MSAAAISAASVTEEEAAPLLEEVQGAPSRAPGALVMSIGTVASGVMAYAFNAVAARALGPSDYGPIAVLWAAMFLVAIVLFRPVEQTLSRGVAERLAAGEDTRPVARAVGRLASAAVIASAVACALLWGPITDRLFAGQQVLTAMLVAGIAGYGASYYVRGLVGGRRWYAGYGQLLLADGGVRLALALPLFAVASPALAAVALAAAAISGAVVPLLAPGWRRRRHLDGAPAPAFHLASAARFAGPVTVLAAADQILLSGGPVLVMIHGGHHAAAAAGVVFAATMLVRAPAYLFQGVAAALLPNLTTMLVQRDQEGFRRALTLTIAVLAGFAGVMALGALVAGPGVMHILYGSGFEAGRIELALLAIGAGGYLVAATLSQAALARSQATGAAVIWALSALLFVVLELALGGDPLQRVSIAFAVATLANAAAFAALSVARRAGGATPRLRVADQEA